jgi:hypothetical protein
MKTGKKQQKGQQQTPIWRIVAVINFPMEFILSKTSFTPGQVTKATSRIPDEASLEVDGISVRLRPWPGPTLPAFSSRRKEGLSPEEQAALVFLLAADNPELAYKKIIHLLEELLDSLSFQLQAAIQVFRLEVLDVTPPVEIGMERYFALINYSSAKFLLSSRPRKLMTSFYPHLDNSLGSASTRRRAALRWYIKGLEAHYAVDKFIFFWIALEILRSESGVSVSSPYIARCGHEIPNCPTCGQKTAREELGKSMKKFLTDEAGIEKNTAKKLWEFRQILHGSKDLTHKDISELPQLVEYTREAAVVTLKKALAWPPTEPPLFRTPMGPIITGVGINWNHRRVLDANDVTLGLPDESLLSK